MSVRGTQLKLTGHHGYGCLPPHCRRAALNVGSSAEDRPDSELLRMRTSDPKKTFAVGSVPSTVTDSNSSFSSR